VPAPLVVDAVVVGAVVAVVGVAAAVAVAVVADGVRCWLCRSGINLVFGIEQYSSIADTAARTRTIGILHD